MRPAIVISGHTMALGVVRALGMKGVPVVVVHYDERDMAQTSKYVVQSITSPHPEKDEKQFLDALIRCAETYPGAVVFPVSDESVVAISKNKTLLNNHFLIACPEWDIVSQYIDKKYTYELADKYGVPAPKTIVPASVKDVEQYCKDVQFPCLVKPSQSHLFYEKFKCKMYPVDNAEEMMAVYKKSAEAGLEVMLQEIIPGNDEDVVNYNSYFYDGEAKAEFTSIHVRNAPPWWGSPRVALSRKIPEVIEPGRKILKAMGFYGYACTEFKRDPRDGVYKLMEVNGRHNLSTLLSVRCGINFPWLQYKHMVDGELPSQQDFETDIYWIDITRDMGYSIKHYKQEGYSVSNYLKPYFGKHIFAIFDIKDIRPFIRRCAFLMKEGVRTLNGKLKLQGKYLMNTVRGFQGN